MGNLDGATITILNWEKYNPRKDIKATNWLRLQNTIFEDPNFFDFTHSELLFWIYLLSMASKRHTGEVRFSLKHAERIGRFEAETIESALAKLLDLECVRVTERARNEDVTSTVRTSHATNERTDETIHAQRKRSAKVKSDFDLEKLYEMYPRKREKGRGLDKLAKEIRTQEDYDQLATAISNYAKEVEGEEQKHMKFFSSFASCWREWVDIDPKPQQYSINVKPINLDEEMT